MSPSVASAFSNFINAIVGISISLFNSIFAVFQAIIALGMNIIQSAVSIVQHMVTMVIGLFQGVFGFVVGSSRSLYSFFIILNVATANFVALAVLGGAYYAYTLWGQQRRGSLKSRT